MRGRSGSGWRWSRGRPSSTGSSASGTTSSGRVASISATWCRRSGARPRAACSRSPRDRRATRWCGSGAHVDPFLVLLAPALDGVAVAARAHLRPDRGRLARRAARLLARAATPRIRTRRGPARARLPGVPVGCDERGRGDPPCDVRDPVPSLLRLVPRHGPARCRSPSSPSSRCRPASSWGCPSQASASGTRSLARAGRRCRDRRLPAQRGRSSPLLRRPRVRGRGQRVLRLLRPRRRLAARRRAHAFQRSGRDPAALFEGHDIVYLVWLGLPLLFLFVLSPGLAASRSRSCSPTCSPTSAR